MIVLVVGQQEGWSKMFWFWFCRRNRAAFFSTRFHIWNVPGGFPSITSARLEDFKHTLGSSTEILTEGFTDCATRKRQPTDGISTDAQHACLVVQWIMGSASFQQLPAKCETGVLSVFFNEQLCHTQLEVTEVTMTNKREHERKKIVFSFYPNNKLFRRPFL